MLKDDNQASGISSHKLDPVPCASIFELPSDLRGGRGEQQMWDIRKIGKRLVIATSGFT